MNDRPRRWFTSGPCDALWGGEDTETYPEVPFDALPRVGGTLDGSVLLAR